MSRRFEYSRLTAAEFVEKLDEIQMSTSTFARLTGSNLATVNKWANNKNDIPAWVELVLHLFKEEPRNIPFARTWANATIISDRYQDSD